MGIKETLETETARDFMRHRANVVASAIINHIKDHPPKLMYDLIHDELVGICDKAFKVGLECGFAQAMQKQGATNE